MQVRTLSPQFVHIHNAHSSARTHNPPSPHTHAYTHTPILYPHMHIPHTPIQYAHTQGKRKVSQLKSMFWSNDDLVQKYINVAHNESDDRDSSDDDSADDDSADDEGLRNDENGVDESDDDSEWGLSDVEPLEEVQFDVDDLVEAF